MTTSATAPRTSLKQEKIKVLSRHEPITVDMGTSLGESIKAMQAARGDCVLICQGRQLAGIFTERDVLLKVLGREIDLDQPVESFMTASPETLTLDDTVGEALAMMERGGFRNIPLVDGDGAVKGILRNQDVLEYVAESFPEEVLNLPPRPHQKMEEPEGA